MNRILFETMTFLNGFIALAIIVGGAFAGGTMLEMGRPSALGMVLGAGAGFICAALLCGTIAYFALMERHMRQISTSLRADLPGRRAGPAREEPVL